MAGVAERRLDLILRLLAVAQEAGPAPQEELARALDCTPAELDRLIGEITERSFYLPPGAAEDVRVYYDADGLQIETTGEFRRPMRLTGEEALALSLALRMYEGEADGASLAERLEAGLCAAAPAGVAEGFVFADGAAPGTNAAALAAAAAAGQACTLSYLKVGAEHPDTRVVHPYAVVSADAGWYLLAHCLRTAEVRVFRVDRMAEVEVEEDTFERPADFDPAAYLHGGMVYRPGAPADEVEAVVRYAAEVAPWVRERGEVEEGPDGSVLLRMRVSDRRWIQRHVLQFGGAAELLEPPEWRAELARQVNTCGLSGER
jgi:proteasome accessory factor C